MSADTRPDVVLRHARLAGSATTVDIALRGERIAAVEPTVAGGGRRELDLAGALVVPGFVDAHMHLDKAFGLGGGSVVGRSLESAIAGFLAWRSTVSPEMIYRNARRAAEQALLHGTVALRTHTTVDSLVGLSWLEALLRVRDEMAPALQVQVVAFPDTAEVVAGPARRLLRDAMRMGADLIGGAPSACDRPRAAVDVLLDLAGECGCDLDLHVDETDDPASNALEYLAERAMATGFPGRITAGHCCSLAAMDDAVAARVIEKVARAGIRVVTLPMCNLYLMGRHDRGLVRRGLTRVRELQAAGVTVALASDNVRDAFNPFGRADMLLNALVAALALQMGGVEDLRTVLAMATTDAARVLGLTGYGLESGCSASFVVLDDADWGSAVAACAPRRYVFSHGKLVSETTVRTRTRAELQGWNDANS